MGNNKIHSLILSHIRCIEILEGIQKFKKRIKLNQESIDGFAGTFPDLKQKYLHNIEIQKLCISRLLNKYEQYKNQTIK